MRGISPVRMHGHDDGEDMIGHCRGTDIVPRAARPGRGADEDRC